MPKEQKRFGGILNLDDKEEFILPNQHIDALNIRFYGGANGLTARNIVGSTLIDHTLPSGNNQCIGSFYDSLKQRLFWFNWNSDGRNGIYLYDLATNLISDVLVSYTDSTTDIFAFDLDFPIASVNIIYTTEEDGDILTWVARNDKPKELNILDAQNNLFGTSWVAQYLDVCKQPPTIPPVCAYEDDATVIVNNLKNKLYRFKYRFIYGTFQKSTWSSIGKMPIAFDYTDSAVDTDQTKNCTIGIIFQTGTPDVIKIEIVAQENLGVGWGNFFSIQILDKSELSIPDNDTFIWNFYNNEAYDYVDLDESNLLFDYVPDLANTQELLNGNVLIYGGITEGYDPVVPDVSIAVQDESISEVGYPVGMLATQEGTYGVSTGNIRISLVGKPAPATLGTASDVQFVVKVGSSTYIINSSAATIAAMITAIGLTAVGFGFTIVSSTANSIVISQANQILLNQTATGNGNDLKPLGESVPANEFSSNYNYALAYFADKSKTNGATTSVDFSTNITPIDITYTINAGVIDLTRVDVTISNRPPIWAKYYQLLRTNNLTKSSFVSLVSSKTLKNAQFAYISIEALNIYKIQYETSVLSYDFVIGDRIKFCGRYNNDKTVAMNYGNAHDYEIVGQEVNPNINGLVQNGTFVKINLPDTDINFDFGNFTSNDYYYYYIELYTPAKSVANNLNVYYEFGEMFEIGNAGTALAFHQGNDVNQSPDLVTSAVSQIRGGDSYYRRREMRAGAFFVADSVPNVTYVWANEPVLQQTVQVIPAGTTYTVKNTTSGNTSNLNNWLIQTGLSAVSFSIKGKLIFQSLLTTTSDLIIYLQIKTAAGALDSLIPLSQITGASSGQILEFNVDTTITMAASRIAVIYLQQAPVTTPIPFSANSISGQLTFIDTEHDFTIGVIDANFSDFYESKVNSNGRALVVNPDEKTLYYPTLLRWGLSYQQNTNINQINRFFPANFDEVDRSKGDIQRFKTRDRILRLFQNRACGQYGVFARFIQNNQGNIELVTTNDIITKGNVNYYAGEYGLGHQYCGLVSGKNQDYIADPVRGYQVRLSTDGLTPISELYKGQFTIRDLIIPYNQVRVRPLGGEAKILGTYNFQLEEYICLLQSSGLDFDPTPAYAFSFNELRNGYSSFFSYNAAEWIANAEELIYTWKDGQLWKHNNTNAHCNFFGEQFPCYITLVFNINFLQVKTWESVAEVASQIWECPLIYTSVKSYANQRQESELIEQDFADLEGEFKAAFLRDIHSQQGIINGDILKGSYVVCKFQVDTPTNEVVLSEVSILYQDSPLNK